MDRICQEKVVRQGQRIQSTANCTRFLSFSSVVYSAGTALSRMTASTCCNRPLCLPEAGYPANCAGCRPKNTSLTLLKGCSAKMGSDPASSRTSARAAMTAPPSIHSLYGGSHSSSWGCQIHQVLPQQNNPLYQLPDFQTGFLLFAGTRKMKFPINQLSVHFLQQGRPFGPDSAQVHLDRGENPRKWL